MPALSPTMEKGNLAKWLKKEGETIKRASYRRDRNDKARWSRGDREGTSAGY